MRRLINSRDPIIIPVHVPVYPHFKLDDCLPIIEVLFSHGSVYMETWNAKDNQWETHTHETIHTVETGATLLYRLLPDGITGAQLDDCPGLADKLLKLGPTKLSAAKRKRVELEDSNSDLPALQTPIHKQKRGHTTTPTPTPAPSSHR